MLRSYSLVESAIQTQGYSMHAVVHRWVYFFHGVQQPDLGWLALKVIGFAVPMPMPIGGREHVRLRQRLLPHINMCSAKILRGQKSLVWGETQSDRPESRINIQETEDLLAVMQILGLFFAHFGKTYAAEELYLRVLQGGETFFEPNHVLILETTNYLGKLYPDQHRLDEAEKMLLRARHGFKAIGVESRITLDAICNLGRNYIRQGKFDEAEKLLEQVRQRQEEKFGPRDYSTLRTITALSYLYFQQHEHAKAEALVLRVLQGCEQETEPEHILMLGAVDNLGNIYLADGRIDEAETMYQQAFLLKEEAFGPMHLATLDSLGCIGHVNMLQGKLDEAEAMILEALQGYKQVLGPEHVETNVQALNSMWRLGSLYSRTRPNEAKAMYSQALAGFTKVRGSSSDACVKLRLCLKALSIVNEHRNVDSGSNSRSEVHGTSGEAQTQEQEKKLQEQKLKQRIKDYFAS